MALEISGLSVDVWYTRDGSRSCVCSFVAQLRFLDGGIQNRTDQLPRAPPPNQIGSCFRPPAFRRSETARQLRTCQPRGSSRGVRSTALDVFLYLLLTHSLLSLQRALSSSSSFLLSRERQMRRAEVQSHGGGTPPSWQLSRVKLSLGVPISHKRGGAPDLTAEKRRGSATTLEIDDLDPLKATRGKAEGKGISRFLRSCAGELREPCADASSTQAEDLAQLSAATSEVVCLTQPSRAG